MKELPEIGEQGVIDEIWSLGREEREEEEENGEEEEFTQKMGAGVTAVGSTGPGVRVGSGRRH